MNLLDLFCHGALLFAVAVSACFVSSTRPATATWQETAGRSDGAEALYVKRCSGCHGKDGRASGLRARLMGARNLTDVAWQADVSDERVFNSISNGRGKMPSFGKKLSTEELESLVAYVRHFKK